jgi:hypothetical protein
MISRDHLLTYSSFQEPSKDDGKYGIKLDEDITINELNARNAYEAQVLSSLPTLTGKRIKSYRPRKLSDEAIHVMNMALNKFINNQDSSVFNLKPKLLDKSSEVECDLYFTSTSFETESIEFPNLFRDAIENQRLLSSSESKVDFNLSNKWVFIEVCEDPKLLPNKLAQLERAARLLPILDDKVDLGGFAVLLNGDKANYEKSMSALKLSDELVITKYPLLIGWVSARNVFSLVKNVERAVIYVQKQLGQMEELQKEQGATLKEQGATLKEQGATLKEQVVVQKEQGEQLLQIKELLKKLVDSQK